MITVLSQFREHARPGIACTSPCAGYLGHPYSAAGDSAAVAPGTLPLVLEAQSKTDSRQPKLSPEMIALSKEMANNNRLWGAERIRGELLKLGIRACKRTIQKYMRGVRTPRATGQS